MGAGPVGLYAAYYAGFRGLTVAVIDALAEAGGQITSLYPEKEIHDVAGFRAVRGIDLVSALVEQAAQFDPLYLLGRQAIGYERDGEEHVLSLSDGTSCAAAACCSAPGSARWSPSHCRRREPSAAPASSTASRGSRT